MLSEEVLQQFDVICFKVTSQRRPANLVRQCLQMFYFFGWFVLGHFGSLVLGLCKRTCVSLFWSHRVAESDRVEDTPPPTDPMPTDEKRRRLMERSRVEKPDQYIRNRLKKSMGLESQHFEICPRSV